MLTENIYFTVEMLSEVLPALGDLHELVNEDPVLFFEPPSMDDRISNQFALFSVLPAAATVINDWLRARPELWRRIIIPADLKWEIRDKLDQANITERVLFPGLDGLSCWLRRHYSPKLEARKGPSARLPRLSVAGGELVK